VNILSAFWFMGFSGIAALTGWKRKPVSARWRQDSRAARMGCENAKYFLYNVFLISKIYNVDQTAVVGSFRVSQNCTFIFPKIELLQ
jgi:hypothetical protein